VEPVPASGAASVTRAATRATAGPVASRRLLAGY
jgi:hypothetical protein